MHDPEQAKQAILLATTSLASAFTAMKAQAAIIQQAPLHRQGVERGIDLCLEVIEEFERNFGEVVDEVMPTPAGLRHWVLTLPFVTGTEEDQEQEWLNPDQWPGDWQRWRNRDTMVVAAMDEEDARRLAAEDDCGIWLDPAYASCELLSAAVAGVVISSGGEAENE